MDIFDHMPESEEVCPCMRHNKTALDLIADERQRQKDEEGWTEEHDDTHTDSELARAAVTYALPSVWRTYAIQVWPWASEWWKPTPNDRVHELVKAGALIVAEIERLQRCKK